jgi:hypothetical protein
MKIHPLGAEFFHADRRTDGHEEALRSLAKLLKCSLHLTEIIFCLT